MEVDKKYSNVTGEALWQAEVLDSVCLSWSGAVSYTPSMNTNMLCEWSLEKGSGPLPDLCQCLGTGESHTQLPDGCFMCFSCCGPAAARRTARSILWPLQLAGRDFLGVREHESIFFLLVEHWSQVLSEPLFPALVLLFWVLVQGESTLHIQQKKFLNEKNEWLWIFRWQFLLN